MKNRHQPTELALTIGNPRHVHVEAKLTHRSAENSNRPSSSVRTTTPTAFRSTLTIRTGALAIPRPKMSVTTPRIGPALGAGSIRSSATPPAVTSTVCGTFVGSQCSSWSASTDTRYLPGSIEANSTVSPGNPCSTTCGCEPSREVNETCTPRDQGGTSNFAAPGMVGSSSNTTRMAPG